MSMPSNPNSLLSPTELLLRLEEAEETLRAIRSGEVDALIVSGRQGDQVFTLKDATLPYQVLIEEMNEGALTINAKGVILYCNSCFAEMLDFPIEKVIGESFFDFVSPQEHTKARQFVEQRQEGKNRGELTLRCSLGEIPASISLKEIVLDDELRFGIVVTDLTEQKQVERELRRHRDHLEELVQERTAELERANKRLASSDQRTREILSSIQDDFYVLDRNWTFIYTNRQFTSKFGKEPEDFIGKNIWEMFPKHLGTPFEETLRAVMAKREIQRFEFGGNYTHAPYMISVFPSADGITVLGTDITERKRAEEKLYQLNRTLKALNHSSQALLHSKNEKDLLEEVCKIIVADCGHTMIWIGFKEEDEQKSVRPVASAGFEEGYLETLKVTWADTERGRGPTGTAIRTGKPSRCQNMLTDPLFAPWREQALKRGYASSLVLPLKLPESTLGAISIYSRQPDAFLEEEEKLLTELASDLAYGITALRLRAAHAQAEEALHESEGRYRGIVETAEEGIATHEPDGTITYVNQRMADMLGYSREQIIGKSSLDFVENEEKEGVIRARQNVKERGSFSQERKLRRKDGSVLWTLVNISPRRDSAGNFAGYLAMHTDISERKRAEEALQNLNAELELRVQKRTKELAAANQELSDEIYERKEVERQLRIQTTAMEAAANGILITDHRGNIQWTNPAVAEITGYDPRDLLGESTRIFNSGEQDHAFYSQLWNTILSGQVWRGEMINRRKDGSIYIEEETITPVHDESGHIPHFIAVKQDISKRKQAEEELARQNIELQIISDAEHKQRQLSEALVQAALILNKSLKQDEVLVLILRQIKEVIPYRLANIALSAGETFYDACHQGDLEWPISGNQFLLESFPLINKMRQPGKSILIPDTAQESTWVIAEDGETVRSFLSAPLMAEENAIGFVNLFSDQPGFFTEEMSNRLVAFAAHAAVAIQNAWLFEQVQASSERLQSLSHRLVEIQENERLYIARELHDEAGQMLTSLMLDLVTLQSHADQPEAVLKKAADMEAMLSAVSENLHNVAMALRPASLDHLGLVPALRQHVESVGERYKLKASFTAGHFPERLPANIEIELYRIVQEALTNVARHAHASQVDVVLTVRDRKLIVLVEDDGSGFDPEKIPPTGHLGVFGMRERAEMIGGELIIESQPGKGTMIMVEVDYDSSIIDRG